MSGRYPDYDVLDKWSSVSFDTVTRGVLRRRLHTPPGRRFFTAEEWDLVEAAAAHLAPTPERGGPIPITPWIDDDLHHDRGEGYRTEGMPPPREAWRRGLAGLEREALRCYGRGFTALDPGEQAPLLRRMQAGEAEAASWEGVDPRRFFTDLLLKAVVGVYYAHPAAWSEIGFGGPASPRGYVRTGLGERDPWEARERRR